MFDALYVVTTIDTFEDRAVRMLNTQFNARAAQAPESSNLFCCYPIGTRFQRDADNPMC